jgi:Beta protein
MDSTAAAKAARPVRYLPILKAKDAEYRALKEITVAAKAAIAPLLEIPSIPWDYESEKPTRSIDEHIAPVAARVQGVWGKRLVYLDLGLVAEERMGDGSHPVDAVFAQAAALALTAMPVVALDSSPGYRGAVAAACARDGRGVCLRLQPDDLVTPNSADIDALLAELGVIPGVTDIVVDLAAIPRDQEGVLILAWSTILRALPRLAEWRTLAIAASAFPQSLTGLAANSITQIPRAEWQVYLGLAAAGLPRLPDFADYAIAHPEPVEMDPRLMRISAQIRYAAADDWLVARGRNTRDFGWGQTEQLAKALVGRTEFMKGHCTGDKVIEARAVGQGSSGSAMTWRRDGTIHHLELVVEQLTTLFAP